MCQARFSGTAWFDRAQFSGTARFDEAQFSGTAQGWCSACR
nr:pentapeptide repeat-containing protein [Streptomyces botrytidirepellens]